MSELIKLSQGKFAVIDDEDYAVISKHKWSYNCGYAVRAAYVNGKRTLIRMHVQIANANKDELVLHQNRDSLDNRKENLIVKKKGKPSPRTLDRIKDTPLSGQLGASSVVRIRIHDPARSAATIRDLFGTQFAMSLAKEIIHLASTSSKCEEPSISGTL